MYNRLDTFRNKKLEQSRNNRLYRSKYILSMIKSHNENYKKKHSELHFLKIDYKKFSRRFYRNLKKFDELNKQFKTDK